MTDRLYLPVQSYPRVCALLDDRLLWEQHGVIRSIIEELCHSGIRRVGLSAIAAPWAGCAGSLLVFLLASCGERRQRGAKNAVLDYEQSWEWVVQAQQLDARKVQRQPNWMAIQALQASHQSVLIRRDPEHYARWFPNAPLNMPYLWPAEDGLLDVVDDKEWGQVQSGRLVIPKKFRKVVAI